MVMQKSSITQKFAFVLMLLCVSAPTCNYFKQQQNADQAEDLFDMSLIELMEVEVESPEALPETDCWMFPSPVITTAQNQTKTGSIRSLNESTSYGAGSSTIMV